MSVPTWKRGENKLDLFMSAKDFAIHIVKITQNESIFLPIFKESVINKINNAAIELSTNLWKANNHKLGTDSRKFYQKAALDNCIDFLALWDLAKRACHLKNSKTEFVVKWILEIRDAIKKWINSDIDRLKNLEQ